MLFLQCANILTNTTANCMFNLKNHEFFVYNKKLRTIVIYEFEKGTKMINAIKNICDVFGNFQLYKFRKRTKMINAVKKLQIPR